MTTLAPIANPKPSSQATSLLMRAWQISPGLTVLVAFSLTLIALSTLGLFLDPRTTAIIHTPVWAKTFKFSLSIALYAAGLLWAISLTAGQAKAGRASRIAAMSGGLVGWILSLELVLIVFQAVRAQPIHFNVSTPFDAALWSIMSIGVTVMLLAFIVLLVSVWRSLNTNPVLAWSVRLGVLVTLIGLLQGYLMPQPTPTQLEALKAGQTVNMIGAHTVGTSSLTPDDGPGLPLLGWNTTHGDLRIGHFVGLHALQLIPLLGLLLLRRRERWLTSGHRLGLVGLGAIGYLGLVALVTWQALRGQPLIAPDALTTTAFLGLVGFVMISSAATLAHARVMARGRECRTAHEFHPGRGVIRCS